MRNAARQAAAHAQGMPPMQMPGGMYTAGPMAPGPGGVPPGGNFQHFGDGGMARGMMQQPQMPMQMQHFGDGGMARGMAMGGQMAPGAVHTAGPMAPPPQGYQPMNRPAGGMAGGFMGGNYSNPMIGNALRGLGQPIQYASRAGRMRNAARHMAAGL